ILVNKAGIQHVAPIDQFPVEKWDAILSVNLSSAFHTMRSALPAMCKNKFGRIINIASAHGLVASPFKAAYVAAKHGIVGLTKVAALETAEDGITCNAICPGYVYTPLVEAQIDGQAKAHGISREAVIQDVLVLQGGGALGSYQAGVYQALHEAGIEPDWIIGTSIGAINASLIAGNAPQNRLSRLREFWKKMEQNPVWSFRDIFPGFNEK